MTYGITEQGFVRKPYTVILSEAQAKARALFGSDIDLSETSPDGMWVILMCWAIDRQWQLAEDSYYSNFLSTSTGVNLDRNVKFGLLSRRAESYAEAELLFKGTNDTMIAAGTLCETSGNIVYKTLSDVVIAAGQATVVARCQTAGASGMVAAGSITTIKTPISGVDSVTNPEASYNGYGRETDAELKERYQNLPSSTGSSCDALRVALSKLTGVLSSMVFENTMTETNSNGLPPNSFEAVVTGGDDAIIASTINTKKPMGIDSYGNTTRYITDSQGLTKRIRFSRPEQIDVYVIYTLTVNEKWGSVNIPAIIRKAIKYIGGVDDQLTEYGGVGIGQTIYAWQLTAIQAEVGGIVSIDVTLGKTPSPTGKDNLTFAPREIAKANYENVIVRIQ